MAQSRITFIHALSPLHAGIGQGAGIIDLPIAREKAIGLPFLPGSSLKGPLRDRCEGEHRNLIFGPEATDGANYRSTVQCSDQHLLLFPVRSLAGTFAWATSPFILKRLVRDLHDSQTVDTIPDVPPINDIGSCLLTEKSALLLLEEQKVYLEDLPLQYQVNKNTTGWANWLANRLFPKDDHWHTLLQERLCIIHDDLLSFLTETATEITARIKLQEDSKTVQEGGLWYEETLPAESVLSGLITITPLQSKAEKYTTQKIENILQGLIKAPLQLGGKATVGRGLCRLRITNAKGSIVEEEL